jgi:transposase
MRNRQKFTNEFKEEAVRIALTSNQPLAQTASELGIKKSTFYGWIKDNMQDKIEVSQISKPSGQIKALEDENRKLKQQLKRTEQERDLLKKAAAYFANQGL